MSSTTLHHTLFTYDSTPKQLFSRNISDWNKLPTHLIEITDTDTFKTELQSYCSVIKNNNNTSNIMKLLSRSHVLGCFSIDKPYTEQKHDILPERQFCWRCPPTELPLW